VNNLKEAFKISNLHVAARNDEQPDAQWRAIFGANYLRRKRASDAQSLRHNANGETDAQ
jgi:hypothetical protein